MGQRTVTLAEGLHIPASATPVFWTMTCQLTTKGNLRKTLLRLPEVDVVEKTCAGSRVSRRVVMDLLSSPVLGNALPGSLAEFAAVFQDRVPGCPVDEIIFESGLTSYSGPCQVEFLHPTPISR